MAASSNLSPYAASPLTTYSFSPSITNSSAFSSPSSSSTKKRIIGIQEDKLVLSDSDSDETSFDYEYNSSPSTKTSKRTPNSTPSKAGLLGSKVDRRRSVEGVSPLHVLLEMREAERRKTVMNAVNKKIEEITLKMAQIRARTTEDIMRRWQEDLRRKDEEQKDVEARKVALEQKVQADVKSQLESEQEDYRRRTQNLQLYELQRAEEERIRLEEQARIKREEEEKARQEAERKRREAEELERKRREAEAAQRLAAQQQQQAEEMRKMQASQLLQTQPLQAQPPQPQPLQLQPQQQQQPAPITSTPTSQPIEMPSGSSTFQQTDYVSSTALEYYLRLQKQLSDVEEELKSFESHPNRKELYKQIHKTCYQISNLEEQIKRVVKTLEEVYASTKNSPIEQKYCKFLIAQKLVEQTEKQISKNKSSAWPVANVAMILCSKIDGLLDMILSHLHRKCPYTVPMYPKRKPNQTPEQYFVEELKYDKLGDELEDEESYLTRMAGYAYLYASMLSVQYNPHENPQAPIPHEHGLDKAWTWLARILNLPPRRVTPFVLRAFLEHSAYFLLRRYNQQFVKLLMYIKEEMIPRIPQGVAAAKARLELFVEAFEKTKTIPLPEGYKR